MNDPVNDLATFLAHSLALERESAERLREFANTMRGHNQHELADTFEQLAGYSDLHAAEVETICGDRKLPVMQAWEFAWPDLEAPETCQYDNVRYDMSKQEAIEILLAQEEASAAFYSDVARRTRDEAIRDFARAFAAEEQEHARALTQWMARVEQDGARVPDIDPPNLID